MRYAARLGQHFIRKHPRQLVLADHHLHVYAEVVRIAEHFDHTANRGPCRRGPAGDLHVDHQAFQVAVHGGGCCFCAEDTVRRSGLGCGLR